MGKKKRWLSLCIAGSLIAGCLSGGGFGLSDGNAPADTGTVQAAEKTITVDGSTKRTGENSAFCGLGAVTCNGSSRLLMDYKEENPDQYWEIINWLFNPETGAGISHIKIELGCDLDTSSGAEPATKRTSWEAANVKRGAGFMFAHDALTVNPDITVDMLCWGMPAWVENAYAKSNAAGYKARYKWYKETMDAAYDVWGIQFSYVSANQNERSIEKAWTKYLRSALDSETTGRYDYKNIKLVAADETDTMEAAAEMLKDEDYRNAVDVIGCHYNSYMDDNVKKLHDTYQKEIWFSEGASVATDSIFGSNNTTDGVSTSGTNGMLDIANRIIIGMAQSDMTMYEFQPAIASYYDGAVYYPKQLISANQPWSGFYQNTNGLVMAMHFTNFIKKGWQIVDSASYGDGTQTDHYITDTSDDYLTAMDENGDYSMVITNDSKTERTYQIQVKNTDKALSNVSVWETKTSSEGESYDAGWLKKISTITPENGNGTAVYTITTAPYSMVTLTTTEGQTDYSARKAATNVDNSSKKTALSLPYTDDFEYSADYIERRGGTPRYTNDKNGAFEVVADANGNYVLRQQINQETLGSGWSGTAVNPVTSVGDDTWKDYVVSVDVRLDDTESKNNYAALCARFNAASSEENGFWLRLYKNGTWVLYCNGEKLAKSKVEGVSPGRWNNLKLKVQDNTVTAYINHVKVAKKTVSSSVVNSGRVALGSAFCQNAFDNLKVKAAAGGVSSITRVDDMDSSVVYSGSVERLQSQSYTNYGRTLSKLTKKGDTLTYSFSGTGIALLGANSTGTKISVTFDKDADLAETVTLKDSSERCAFYRKTGLTSGTHTVTVKLLNSYGLDVDALEISGETEPDTAVAAETLTITDTELELACGQSTALQTAVSPESALQTVYYTTSDASVAVVTSDGKVAANGAGTAVVTAHAQGGLTAQVQVTVTELAVTPRRGIRVGVGESVKLTAAFKKKLNEAEITGWQSSDPTVATVSAAGKVKALKAGEVTITATAENGYQGSAVIRVWKAPYKITAAKKLTLKKGKEKQISCNVPAGCKCNKYTYKSSKKSVVSVTSSGKLKAKKKGTAVITIQTYNGKKAKIKVTVK
ncbi:MAG: Ig-like domain-containing protein [Clostridiaceae bacterium]|nr:Ig-like domain-containing protein [Clostridiaceae bacterium]